MQTRIMLVLALMLLCCAPARAELDSGFMDIAWGTPFESIPGLLPAECSRDYCTAPWPAARPEFMGATIDTVTLSFIHERFFEAELAARMELDAAVPPSPDSQNFQTLLKGCLERFGDTAFEYRSGVATVRVCKWEQPQLRAVLTATPSQNSITLRILHKPTRELLRDQDCDGNAINPAARIMSDIKHLGTSAWNFINSGEPLKDPQESPQR